MSGVDAADLARRIVDVAPGAASTPLNLLEHIFGSEGDGAILSVLAYWGLSVRIGEARPRDVRAVADALRDRLAEVHGEGCAFVSASEDVTPYVANGEPNSDAPLAVLLTELFSDGYGDGTHDAVGFLSNVLRSIADDAELAVSVDESEVDHALAVERTIRRIESRARIAVAVARRIEKGDVRS